MNKFKILVLTISLILLSGCTNQYNLEIKEDLSISEKIIIMESKAVYESPANQLEMAKESFNAGMQINDKEKIYYYEFFENKDNYGIEIVKDYANFNEYLSKSLAYKKVYDDLSYIVNGDTIILSTIGNFKTENFTTGSSENATEEEKDGIAQLIPKDCYFSIKLPFNVIYHNADKVDKKENIYYWLINQDTIDKEINISFDSTKKYFNFIKVLTEMDYTLFLIIGIIILGIYVMYSIKTKSENNNRI